MRKDIEEIKANDECEKLTTIAACKKDLRKIFIRFMYLKDVEECRSLNNPTEAVKEVFKQIGIDQYKSQ